MASGPPWLVSGFRFRARLGFSIPSTFSGPRGVIPAFGYSAPHSSARGTSTLLINALLRSYLWASPTPDRAASRLCLPARRCSLALAAVPGLPGSSTDLSTRAVPNHPGRPSRCICLLLPHRHFFRLHPARRTGRLRFANEAESGLLALRLTCSPHEFPPTPLLEST